MKMKIEILKLDGTWKDYWKNVPHMYKWNEQITTNDYNNYVEFTQILISINIIV